MSVSRFLFFAFTSTTTTTSYHFLFLVRFSFSTCIFLLAMEIFSLYNNSHCPSIALSLPLYACVSVQDALISLDKLLSNKRKEKVVLDYFSSPSHLFLFLCVCVCF